MDNDTHGKGSCQVDAVENNRAGESEFRISKQTDGRWQVEYSKGKHNRVYPSLIDATEGVLAAASINSGPYSISITR
jgi:hypothetical protein